MGGDQSKPNEETTATTEQPAVTPAATPTPAAPEATTVEEVSKKVEALQVKSGGGAAPATQAPKVAVKVEPKGSFARDAKVSVDFRPFGAPLAFLAAAKKLGMTGVTCGAQVKTAPEKPTATGSDGTVVSGALDLVETLIGACAGDALLGLDAGDEATVMEWLVRARDFLPGGGFEKQCGQVNDYLATRTYLAGHGLTLADLALWAEFTTNRQWPTVAKKGKCGNIERWLATLNADADLSAVVAESEAGNPILAKTATTVNDAGKKVGAKTSGSYEINLPGAEEGKVVTRFPPEPSGILHIGHAKAALLNAYFAKSYKGKLIVRFDDTNPDKENDDFVEGIMKDIATLGLDADVVTYTSDSFDAILEMGEKLIKEGKMYIDTTDVDTMREERMKKIESKCRSQSVDENLRLWKEMKAGSKEGAACAARFKIDMSSNNGTMRDPVAFRCNVETPHHRTGTKYKVYPTYDCACPFVDAHEGVTHALRTSEYADREEQYVWIQAAMGMRKVHIWEYSRLNLEYTTLSKRKLQWFVDNGYATGWDDPRFPTVQGVVRRGLQVEALKEFMVSQGASKNLNLMEWSKIWAMNKKIIDPIAPRHVCVNNDNAVVVKVLNYPEGEKWFTTPKHKKNPDLGVKVTLRMNEILLDQGDAQAISEGEECTLMDWGNAIFKNIVKEGDVVKSMECEINPDGDIKSTKLKLTWLANWNELVPVIMKDFDYLITKKKPEDADEFADIVNKCTEVETLAKGDGNLRAYNKGQVIQIERKGYFVVDRVYVNMSTPMILLSIPDGKKPSWGVSAVAK
jgi:glutamyl-tRNA synthetase